MEMKFYIQTDVYPGVQSLYRLGDLLLFRNTRFQLHPDHFLINLTSLMNRYALEATLGKK